MLLLIHIRVADFDKWKPIFDEREATRVQHGGTRHWLYRSADNRDDLVVSVQFPTVEAARSYVNDPALREAMGRAGVQGPPEFLFLEEVEDVTY